jgi:transcriptional regulator of acetoin/glycerol metabolism
VPASLDDASPNTLSVSGPSSAATPPPRQRYRRPDDVSVDELRRALQASDWCIRRAAQALGISHPSLYNLIARYPEAKQR